METQPTKIEYAVAKYLKNNVPTKKTKFLNHQVSYFNANKAIDVLLDSPWATGENALFTDRVSVVEFGNNDLSKQKIIRDSFSTVNAYQILLIKDKLKKDCILVQVLQFKFYLHITKENLCMNARCIIKYKMINCDRFSLKLLKFKV
ncbi:hypothetical protein Avbf_17563 [Armadillidium vulgare]|nr:hypothetical protein Avbf_17563 [Armadillidium vulgare]